MNTKSKITLISVALAGALIGAVAHAALAPAKFAEGVISSYNPATHQLTIAGATFDMTDHSVPSNLTSGMIARLSYVKENGKTRVVGFDITDTTAEN